MKVTRDTPEQLIVDHFSILMAVMTVTFGAIFLGTGLFHLFQGKIEGLIFVIVGGSFTAIILYYTERVQVILDRQTDKLIIRRRNIFGYKQIEHDLSDLDRAVLEKSVSNRRNPQELYRATLVLESGMSAGRHPIVEVYTNLPGSRKTVHAINRWLDSHRLAT